MSETTGPFRNVCLYFHENGSLNVEKTVYDVCLLLKAERDAAFEECATIAEQVGKQEYDGIAKAGEYRGSRLIANAIRGKIK